MSHIAPLVFTAEEEAKLRKLFDHLDVERKGYITHENLRHLCHELGRDISQEKAEELILRCDPDKVGRIAWEPFVRAMSTVIPKLIVAVVLIAAFKSLDEGKTGYIARADLERLVLENGAKIDRARLDALILETHPGADGRIEFKTFIAALVAHLRAI